MSRPFILGAGVVLAVALCGIWFATAVMLPSAATDAGVPALMKYGLPPYLAWTYGISNLCAASVTPVAIFTAFLLLAGLIGSPAKPWTRLCRTTLVALALLLSFAAIFLLVAGGGAHRIAYLRQSIKLNVYRAELERFALLKTADEGIDRTRKYLERSGRMRVVEVSTSDEYSPAEASDMIRRLKSILRDSSPANQRIALASLTLFRKKYPKYFQSDLDKIQETAGQLGAPKRDTIIETLDWVAEQPESEGWKPIPLMRITM